jgi:hypothetical protein
MTEMTETMRITDIVVEGTWDRCMHAIDQADTALVVFGGMVDVLAVNSEILQSGGLFKRERAHVQFTVVGSAHWIELFRSYVTI